MTFDILIIIHKNMFPQTSTFEDAIPGLLGEGDVLGVRIEGHRFASVK